MNKDKPVKMRKPSEMTEHEHAHACRLLPIAAWYNKHTGAIELPNRDLLFPKHLKPFFDYLASINVDPYGDQ